MKIKKTTPFLIAILLGSLLHAQEAKITSGGTSSILWANGSGLPGIEFTINGKLLTRDWFAGANGGAGPKNTTKWDVSFKPPAPNMGFTQKFDVEDRSSSVALLIGDFKSFSVEELTSLYPDLAEQIPPGFTKPGPKGFTRAALLRFAVPKEAAKKYPVYIVNGIPESVVNLKFKDGKSFELLYGKPEIYMAEANVEVHMGIQVDAHKEIAGFRLDSLHRGGLLSFYRKPGGSELGKMFANLDSIESLEYRAAHPKPEEEEESE
jgi:hypothetical protein